MSVGAGRDRPVQYKSMGIKENIGIIREKIAKAAKRAGRDPDGVTLMAVTKKIPVDVIREAAVLGITDMGENKVQEASEKTSCPGMGTGIKWHMIGHLQTNKVKQAVRLFDEIHSVDSIRLAREIHKRSAEAGKVMPVYIEVNVSGETSKYGVPPSGLSDLLEEAKGIDRIEVKGLMTMAPYSDDPEDSRPYFRELTKLAREHGLSGLSMGMSGDFEVAIEEGATIIRVGTAIFEDGKA